MPLSVTAEHAKGLLSRVERTLLSAAFDFDFAGLGKSKSTPRSTRRTGVSALHLPHQHAAVHVEHVPGDVGRIVGSQKAHCAGNVLRHADPA